jgi:hypothetical protein
VHRQKQDKSSLARLRQELVGCPDSRGSGVKRRSKNNQILLIMSRAIKSKMRVGTALAIAAAGLVLMFATNIRSDDSKVDPASGKKTDSPIPAAKTPPKHLSGAELYSMHCNRCHPERYPTERTAAQWKTILLHMRVRANLPADQARTILKYLQDNSGR